MRCGVRCGVVWCCSSGDDGERQVVLVRAGGAWCAGCGHRLSQFVDAQPWVAVGTQLAAGLITGTLPQSGHDEVVVITLLCVSLLLLL